jgi:hypothetical protein
LNRREKNEKGFEKLNSGIIRARGNEEEKGNEKTKRKKWKIVVSAHMCGL